MENLKSRLQAGIPIILDGATATELQRQKFSVSPPLWTSQVLLTEKGCESLKEIHKNYIYAGADIITANTFRTNRRTIAASSIDQSSSKLTKLAVDIARKAVEEANCSRKVYICGSLGPVGDAYQPHLTPDSVTVQDDMSRSIENLCNAGVDFILVETMNNWNESWIVAKLCKEAKIPFMISFVCNRKGFLLNGENFSSLAQFLPKFEPLAISVNCSSIEITKRALSRLTKITDVPLGCYPNVEDRTQIKANVHVDKCLKSSISVYQYVEFMIESLRCFNLSIIGGCCGTTPKHIHVLKQSLTNVTGSK